MLATSSESFKGWRLGAFALLAVLGVFLLAGRADAAPANTQITIDGGGWGHGIGMPQWGAQGMAAQGGYTYDDILSYWYTGTGLKQVSQTSANVPDPLRIGINYVLVNGTPQYRPFLWQDFSPINGSVEVCKPGQQAGGDCFTANPGETWRYRWHTQDGGFCQLTRNGTAMWSHSSSCNVRIFWGDQPNTRVSFPSGDIARTFARGHISFVGPVNQNGQTGFHFNVVLGLEDYVKGIAEVPPSWHTEALKSQAVAARTFGAWKATGSLRADCSCHLVWDTWDQAYRGWHQNSEGDPTYGQRWRDAVDATAGQVVTVTPSSGTLAQTYYSSSTGGATENVSDVWNSNQASFPYLVSKPDPWSALSAPTPTSATTIRWRHVRTAGEIVSALNSGSASCSTAMFPGLTELVDMKIVGTYESGSPQTLRITGIVNGQLTTKDLHGKANSCADRISTLRSRLGIWQSHYLHGFSGFPGTGVFTDIAASPYVEAIEWLADTSITAGCNPPASTRFCPDRLLNRAEMATFMVRAFALGNSHDDGPFVDHLTSEHRQHINSIREAGITVGCSATRYCPTRTLTRAEIATLVVRAAKVPSSSTTHYSDTSGHWGSNAINAAAKAGLAWPCAANHFCPDQTVDRAEMAQWLYRAWQLGYLS